MKKKLYLTLQNGKTLQGYAFGSEGEVSGELVFSTGMVGYIETLTDPCNYGKISSCQVRFKQYTPQKVFTTIKTLNYRLPCVRTVYADICSSHWTVMPRAEIYFIKYFCSSKQ